MLDLTFGEQVKIILSRKGMTIKELAEIIEERTGKKMSRQNLTQRLGRDNFQEQDMRMIAEILECPFHLSILGETRTEEERENRQAAPTEAELTLLAKKRKKKKMPTERDITIGELMDIHQSLDALQETCQEDLTEMVEEVPVETEEVETETEMSEELVQETRPVETTEETEEEGSIMEEIEEAGDDREDVAILEEFEELTEEESLENVQAEAEEEIHEEAQMLQPQDSKKPAKKARGSWRDFFQRRVKKEETAPEPVEETVQEDLEETVAVSEENEPETEEPNFSAEEEIEDRTQVEEELLEDPEEEDLERGDINPYTGHEYETNTVRMHPKRIGYVQVYDRSNHQWTDMTEWAFLGYQERKKALLGNDYEPPIYLD